MTKLLGDPSPDGIAKDGAYMLLQSLLDEPHCCTPKWYFSRQEIDNHSPSRKDGINLKKEMQLRMLYCSFLKDLGIRIRVPQKTIATAIMLCHRFYLRQSHKKNEWQTIATASMFLACKMEETVYSLERFIVVAYELMYMSDPTASQRIRKKEVFEKQKELILTGENLLLVTIAFDFNIQHPYEPLVAALKKLKLLSDTELRKMAWNFVNDSLRTTLCLQYKPHYIAAGSMYLAAKAFKLKLPSGKGKAWWMEFDVSPQQLEEVIQQMILQLGLNKGSVMPSVPEKVTQATVVKEKAASITNDQLTKSKDTNLNVNQTHSQCHKSDSGSPDSVVEDAERSDEGGVQARVIEFKEAGGCKIVSVSVGLSKIEKDRIKETMKRRRCDRATSRVIVAMDDDQDSDAWIARELENGIDLGLKFAAKRHKCDL